MRETRSIFWNLDWFSVLLFFSLVAMGWVNIYAAAYNEEQQSIFALSQEYGKQMLWILTSSILVVFLLFLDARVYEKLAIPIYLSALLLLAGVLIFGTTISGARSWYTFGGFSLQPSEFMKFATALALAKVLTREERDLIKTRDKLLAVLIILLPVILILPQPDLGSAIVYTALIFPLYREGMPSWIIFGILGMGVLFILSLLIPKIWLLTAIVGAWILISILFRKVKRLWLWGFMIAMGSTLIIFSVDFAFNELLEDRHRNRINILLGKAEDPQGIGYNTNQSLIAIGSGGLTGKGFLHGTQTKYDFVPEQTTDFIFCTVGEEWGFLGSGLVVIVFLTLLFRIIFLAERQRSRFSRVYGYSVASILFIHFAVNIAMTVGLAPVIGIPLPFFSYGGSSLWGFTLLLFIFLRLDAYRLLSL
jgi:rod shape determining protein RodA